MNLEYLDLPKVPDHLIIDVYQTIRNTPLTDRHSEPKQSDAEKHNAWNSIKASSQLKEFTKSIFNFKHDVHIFVLSGNLPVHKDNTRDTAYNYVLETGNAITNFHNSDTHEIIEQHNIRPLEWHRLNVSQHHSVEIVNPPRILISVSVHW
jgi:hypothetical protein